MKKGSASADAQPDPGPRTGAAADSADASAAGPERVIKKYPNRRLYDTQTSSYITLVEVKQLVMSQQPFVVRDAKSGDDLTRSILLQIILEEEAGGAPLFSTQVLGQIIRFYGHAMQGWMGGYLEKNIQALHEIQTRMTALGLSQNMAKSVEDSTQRYLQAQEQMQRQVQDQLQKQTEQMLGLFAAMRRNSGR
ncbi:polyhydroxyalkanoate synthesis repressor PhaR [Hylemonella gracilis]|uniref:Polyhydroxyalkonate synthesis repressor, PhaR n=1 Tax=Hylemonella gracilis ATCC 19624 TaxID=887062 RepID=F3KPF2_9BURK|nr:polyhydroxyalkanoate synthesis repressor PhaR [Hylemonella gracilis]EGI78393.1 polyhydroxyalkonate synthesis repressor, PhaR [Hylemonella gracilis ATCC 19624]